MLIRDLNECYVDCSNYLLLPGAYGLGLCMNVELIFYYITEILMVLARFDCIHLRNLRGVQYLRRSISAGNVLQLDTNSKPNQLSLTTLFCDLGG